MALNAYMYNGKLGKQGALKGGCLQKSREGWVEVIAASHVM